ncbi:MAG TPA: glycoside hydrolase family 140 protein [Chthonomonadales bacterium]|nr:glycoside hydrolase family 140 protein [Chthonomonadales bacterium]
MTRIRVSDNGRFLQYECGSPFFYLGDTAWELFHRLSRDEAGHYLSVRARQRFTVVQAVALAEQQFDQPNPYGDLPLLHNDPAQPNDRYFQHVDWVVARAADLGLTVALLPTWGDKWNRKWGGGPEIFTPDNAHAYGRWLGTRYCEAPLIWVLGGDRPIETPAHLEIVRAMAAGLREGDGGVHLMTFHPCGQHTSAQWLHDEPWLDFNMLQSGHTFDRDNWRSVADDYARCPVKPCMDGEPGYEDHPSGFEPANGYLDAAQARKFAYWALFAGAHGHTYGCHSVWQMWEPGREPITAARIPWREALHLPGADQMRHVRALMESRPFLTRVPDQLLVTTPPGDGPEHVAATRDAEGRYAFVYLPLGGEVALDRSRMSSANLRAQWFDPRTGATLPCEAPEDGPVYRSPSDGDDWVLVVDAAP